MRLGGTTDCVLKMQTYFPVQGYYVYGEIRIIIIIVKSELLKVNQSLSSYKYKIMHLLILFSIINRSSSNLRHVLQSSKFRPPSILRPSPPQATTLIRQRPGVWLIYMNVQNYGTARNER